MITYVLIYTGSQIAYYGTKKVIKYVYKTNRPIIKSILHVTGNVILEVEKRI